MASKILLIDGHSILNRAFFGIPDLTNSEGLHTNAVYGFLNILFNQQSQIANFDELLLAIIKKLHEKKCLNKTNLYDFIETLSILYKNDYQRLKIFLQRIQFMMPNLNEQQDLL